MRQSRCLRHLDPAYAEEDYVCAGCTRIALSNLMLDKQAALATAEKIVHEVHFQTPTKHRVREPS